MSQVPVVYVSNADVGKIIRTIGIRKKKTGLIVKAKKANELASTFKDFSTDVTKSSKVHKKINSEVENEQKTTEHEILAVAGSVELMTDDTNKASHSVYSFKTSKRANQMTKYAAESASKRQVNKTNPVEDNEKSSCKRKIQTIENVSDTILDSCKSKRTYELRDKDAVYESESDRNDDSNSDDNINEQENFQPTASVPSRSSQRLRLRSDFELYFEAQRKDRNNDRVTSDRTLQRLKQPRMSCSSLNKVLQEHDKQLKHAEDVQKLFAEQLDLSRSYESHFTKWMFYLCNNFNLLLFGLGSKRNLIHSLCEKHLSGHDKLVVNGFFPAVSLKSILTSVTEDIIKTSSLTSNSDSQLEEIENYYNSKESRDLFLIIHNIDGVTLRSPNVQSALSRLASLHKVHLIASIDQINAPLIWTQTVLSRFHWLWYDVTNYAPYSLETSYEGSLLLSGAGAGVSSRGAALALSGLLHVARSLTSNARGVFRILAERHIENKENKENDRLEDLSFSNLYQKSREHFLVNSELTLRAHLTEFIDHKLVHMRTGADGCEYIIVALNVETLKDYLEQEDDL